MYSYYPKASSFLHIVYLASGGTFGPLLFVLGELVVDGVLDGATKWRLKCFGAFSDFDGGGSGLPCFFSDSSRTESGAASWSSTKWCDELELYVKIQ